MSTIGVLDGGTWEIALARMHECRELGDCTVGNCKRNR